MLRDGLRSWRARELNPVSPVSPKIACRADEIAFSRSLAAVSATGAAGRPGKDRAAPRVRASSANTAFLFALFERNSRHTSRSPTSILGHAANLQQEGSLTDSAISHSSTITSNYKRVSEKFRKYRCALPRDQQLGSLRLQGKLCRLLFHLV